MRILHITDGIPPLSRGGAGRIALDLCRGLQERGHTTGILTAAPAAEPPTPRDGIDIVTIPTLPQRWAHYRSVFSLSRAREVTDVISRWKPDIIHAHVLAWQMGYRWISRTVQKGIPCILTLHDAMTVSFGKVTGEEPLLWWKDLLRARWTMNPLRNSLIRQQLKSCSAILTVSEALRGFLEAHGITVTRTVRNGIDLTFWSSVMPQANARATLGLPSDVPLFLLAGRGGHDKGTDVTARALPPHSHLLLAGGGDLSAFREYGDRCSVFPQQSSEQMRLLYSSCDAVLVPSVYLDPFPTISLEAMAMGRPVIVTTFGGAKEAVIDGVTGWVVDPRSPAFAERLQWCSDHRKELENVGIEARRHVEQHFSRERFLDEVCAVYEKTMQ